ncbi:transmembrane protein induced by tumor necrosis factor alpha [Anaeramoeba flamelloides]|uniref:Transmembrane protein induced by tumor necrosis factor alpha n=1 Tax=Anaeramoeba flamelloides TaxID=1746091 RepID=A0ABQ8ZDT5_9EUKA|nr:transmembrane protein induced by tumor necrosis factor alpha [Anaeramoeba flamelloides]
MNYEQEKHFHRFQEKFEKLRCKIRKAQKSIQSYRTVLSGAHVYENKAENKLRFLWFELNRLNNNCKRLVNEKIITHEEYNEFKIELVNQRIFLRTLRAMLPNKTSNFLSFFVGSVTFYMTDSSERIKVKTEYENFKKLIMLIYGGFSCFMLILHLLNWKSVINLIILPYHLLPVFYYLSLAMRETVLKANGSNINLWWTAHHYFSIILSGSICFCDFKSFDKVFGLRYYIFSIYSCVTQFLQHLYQMNQLYKMKALGIANLEDTVNSDTPTINFFFSLKVLLPFLIITHTFQGYLGIYLIKSFFLLERNVLFIIMGVLFSILAIGNIYLTAKVIYDKIHARSFQSPIRRVSSLSLIMESKIQKKKSKKGIDDQKANNNNQNENENENNQLNDNNANDDEIMNNDNENENENDNDNGSDNNKDNNKILKENQMKIKNLKSQVNQMEIQKIKDKKKEKMQRSKYPKRKRKKIKEITSNNKIKKRNSIYLTKVRKRKLRKIKKIVKKKKIDPNTQNNLNNENRHGFDGGDDENNHNLKNGTENVNNVDVIIENSNENNNINNN